MNQLPVFSPTISYSSKNVYLAHIKKKKNKAIYGRWCQLKDFPSRILLSSGLDVHKQRDVSSARGYCFRQVSQRPF